MSSGKIKINKIVDIDFEIDADGEVVGIYLHDDRKIGLRHKTLEAIYKEYKRKVFNDEMKEIINSEET